MLGTFLIGCMHVSPVILVNAMVVCADVFFVCLNMYVMGDSLHPAHHCIYPLLLHTVMASQDTSVTSHTPSAVSLVAVACVDG